MRHQVNHWLLKVSNQSAIWNLPDLHRAVLRTTGNDVVIVRAPLDVKNSRFVTNYQRSIAVNSTSLYTQNIQLNTLK